MPAHFSLRVSDSDDSLKSSTVDSGFSALSLKHYATHCHHHTQDLYSRVYAVLLHYNHLIEHRCDIVRLLESMPAIHRYKVSLWRIKPMKFPSLLRAVLGTFTIPKLDAGSLHNHLIDLDCVIWTLLESTPATRRYNVPL